MSRRPFFLTLLLVFFAGATAHAVSVNFQNNPLRHGAVMTVTANGVGEGIRVEYRIFDLNRRLVRYGVRTTRPHQFTWDGRSKSGKKVNSGVYILHVKVDAGSGAGKGTYRIAFIQK